jgi:transposase
MVTLSFSKAIVAELEQELIRAHALNNLRLYQLVQGLLWIHHGKSWKTIAQLLGVTVKTVENWLKRFLAQGLSWLHGQHDRGRGRKAKLTGEQKRQVRAWVEAGPQATGFACGVWNTALVAELIWRRLGVRYNPRYLSSLLKKLGLSYQKARFISDRSDEEEYERARREWVEQTWPRIVEQAKATGAVIVFGDEVSFAMWGSLSRTWAPRGQQPLVKPRGIRKGLKMFGAISFLDGAFVYREALAYTLTPKAFKRLRADGVPAEVRAQLAPLKGLRYPTPERFQQALDEVLGAACRTRYQPLLQEAAEGTGRFNGAGYVEFLKQLLARFDAPIILIEDGAPYHRSREVNHFHAEHAQRLTIELLPAFSPEYNPIEKLWRNTKKEATHLKYFNTFDELRASVLRVFHQYLDDATQVIRVMKKLRTKAGIA